MQSKGSSKSPPISVTGTRHYPWLQGDSVDGTPTVPRVDKEAYKSLGLSLDISLLVKGTEPDFMTTELLTIAATVFSLAWGTWQFINDGIDAYENIVERSKQLREFLRRVNRVGFLQALKPASVDREMVQKALDSEADTIINRGLPENGHIEDYSKFVEEIRKEIDGELVDTIFSGVELSVRKGFEAWVTLDRSVDLFKNALKENLSQYVDIAQYEQYLEFKAKGLTSEIKKDVLVRDRGELEKHIKEAEAEAAKYRRKAEDMEASKEKWEKKYMEEKHLKKEDARVKVEREIREYREKQEEKEREKQNREQERSQNEDDEKELDREREEHKKNEVGRRERMWKGRTK
ncbi:unnamed protein product [Fusarium langsethiae]|nr:unnamed protein product [Fusarium langsethiae]